MLRGEKKDKVFAGIHVPDWLYIELLEYSKKYHVSHQHVCRDALKLLMRMCVSPSEEQRYLNPFPNKTKKEKHQSEETEQRMADLERIVKLKAKPQRYDPELVKEVKEYLKDLEKMKEAEGTAV